MQLLRRTNKVSPTVSDPEIGLRPDQNLRYSRHLLLPEIGVEGQQKLLKARVLIVGAGGLGSPVSLYLAAAGVGTIGLVDFDTVDRTNLQRQILFSDADVGQPKLEVARARLTDLNPDVDVQLFGERLTSDNAMDIIQGFDIVIDGTDNFPTRYLVNDASFLLNKPNIYGSIFRFDGQATVFQPGGDGPCYRCLYPEPPPPGMVPSCAEGGVLGILPGVIGLIQATEAAKIIVGKGHTLVGRLLVYNALAMTFRELKLRRDPSCPLCGDSPSVTGLIDYEQFCGVRGGASVQSEAQAVPQMSVQELQTKQQQGDAFLLLDVREPGEYAIAQIRGSQLIPLGELPRRVDELESSRDQEIVIHCHHGGRSQEAAEFLMQQGFQRVSNLAGGIEAWSVHIDPAVSRY